MTFESEGAVTTSTRPHGFGGSPALPLSVSSAQVFPPSAERYSPLPEGAFGPSPPERNVQPLRRKSHIPAKSTSGFLGSMVSPEHPVERLPPLSTSSHVLPPSAVR